MSTSRHRIIQKGMTFRVQMNTLSTHGGYNWATVSYMNCSGRRVIFKTVQDAQEWINDENEWWAVRDGEREHVIENFK